MFNLIPELQWLRLWFRSLGYCRWCQRSNVVLPEMRVSSKCGNGGSRSHIGLERVLSLSRVQLGKRASDKVPVWTGARVAAFLGLSVGHRSPFSQI
jgi:hypothetical protein